MADVTVMMMDAASEKTSHQAISMGPLNFGYYVPSPAGPVPGPAPNIGNTGKLDPGCEKVLTKSKKHMSLKSKVAKVQGNPMFIAAKDVSVAGQNMGTAWCLVGAFTILFEGSPSAMTGSLGLSNSR